MTTNDNAVRLAIARQAEDLNVPAFSTPLWQAIHAVRPFGLDRSAPILVDAGGDGQHRTTWGDFLANEVDGIDAGMVDPEQLARDMLGRPDRTALGGGGASAEWSVRLLIEEETHD